MCARKACHVVHPVAGLRVGDTTCEDHVRPSLRFVHLRNLAVVYGPGPDGDDTRVT